MAALARAGNGSTSDTIFADGFESPLVFNPFVTAATSTCAAASSATPHQGDLTRLCYRFINASDDLTYTHQHVIDSALGVTYDHDLELAPGAVVVVESDIAPFAIDENDYHLATWTASGPARTSLTAQLVLFAYDPYVHLHALLVPSAADCVQGVVSGTPFLSGLTAVTVAPGTPLAGCYRAQNAGGTRLNHDQLVDAALGSLLDDATTMFDQGSVYSVPRSADTATSNTISATWHSGFNADDVTRDTATATITVLADPACHGIATSSTIDYAAQFNLRPQGNLTPAGMRLDMDVSATPLRANAQFTITAHGSLRTATSLFGPRQDTRVIVPLPLGVDLARALSVHASLNGNVPLTPVVDTAARTLTLHTGPIDGPPGSIDLTVQAYADGSTDPRRFVAPSLALDLSFQGFPLTFAVVPDPDAPPILTVPLCAM